MSDDTRDVSQLRVALQDYILDSEAEIRSNLKLGLWRGQHDPIVVKMQQVVDDLIDKARQDARTAALRDALEVANDQRSKFKARDWDDAVDRVVAAIEALGGKR